MLGELFLSSSFDKGVYKAKVYGLWFFPRPFRSCQVLSDEDRRARRGNLYGVGAKQCPASVPLQGLIPFPFFSTLVLFRNRIRFPWVVDGFLKRFGSLERMGKVSLELTLQSYQLPVGGAEARL